MSYNNNKKFTSASNGNKKPFCKVCHDAGKTESVYTSHFVRSLPDMNGKTKITCPILAATECRYCYELGHTTKFCPILEENNKRSKKEKSVSIQYQKAEQRAYSRPIPEPVVEKKYSGAFAALGDDSEEEKPVPKVAVPVPVDEFPALFGSKKEVVSTEKRAISWAAMAEKPAAPVLKSILKPTIKNTPQIASKSWADDSDSEEEEEIQHAPLVRTYSVYNAPLYYDSRSASTDDDW